MPALALPPGGDHVITLDQLRTQFPGWTVREEPSPSATRRRQLTNEERRTGDAAMSIWADDLERLGEALKTQEALVASS
jgi:hypothetical protein